MKKRILGFASVLIMLFVLCSCGNTQNKNNGQNVAGLVSNQNEAKEKIRQLYSKEYNTEVTCYFVEINHIPEVIDYENNFRTRESYDFSGVVYIGDKCVKEICGYYIVESNTIEFWPVVSLEATTN